MAPLKRDTKKMKATRTPSSAQCGVAKRTRRSSGNAQDRISSLPNSILGCILTLLSVREATRMTVLSRRWKEVFSSKDYKTDTIDDNDMWRGQSRRCSNVITALLDARRRDILRLVVQRTRPSEGKMAGWLDTLAKHGVVQDLVLKMPLRFGLPRSIFKCSSLRSLSLSKCSWPRADDPSGVPEWTLPYLTELTLRYIIDLTMHAMEDLLERCPTLLSLSVGQCLQCGELDIRCKNLLSLTIVDRWPYLVRIVDAPKLERLLWMTSSFTLERTIHALTPRLHTLGTFQCRPYDGFRVAVEQVRTIALYTDVDTLKDLQQAILMLHKFPHLETIHMEMADARESNSTMAISFEELTGGPIVCLENSVKTIILRVKKLVRQKLAFTNFLLGAAKTLKSMLIYNKRMAGELLPPESRGSTNAQIIVFGDSNKCSLELMDPSASNIKLADPFMV